jgi:hypothetical protein
MSDIDFDFSEYFDTGDMYSAGTGEVRLEFADHPRLDGEMVEYSFRTVGGATAPAGTVVAAIALVSGDHNILGGGKTTIRNELRPGDIGAARINPLQYARQDGDYYLTITIGGDARNVEFRVAGGRVESR